MDRVFKYDLEVESTQTIKIQKGYKILSIQEQYKQLVLWALVKETNSKVPVEIEIYGTGHAIINPHTLEFLATVQTESGLVWHVFKRKTSDED